MATLRSTWKLSAFVCNACRQRFIPAATQRAFTTTPSPNADSASSQPSYGLSRLSDSLDRSTSASRASRRLKNDSSTPSRISQALDEDPSILTERFSQNLNDSFARDEPYRLHVYSTKHNTHITFVQPARPAVDTTSSGVSHTSASAADRKKMVDVLLSLSTGNIGFRKAGRGSYDAAYQLMAYVLKQIQEKGMLRDINKLEVVLRGFGAGREAVSKVLLGTEGRRIRHKISAVIDATRLKQGGPRSKKPRRLG